MNMSPLAHLGAKSFGSVSDVDSLQLLRELEKLIGAQLPQRYADVLVAYKTAILFYSDVRLKLNQKSPWQREDGTQTLEMLYGLSPGDMSVFYAYETYHDRMPRSVIAIGDVGGANRICLGVKGTVANKVYYWDPDDEREITGDPTNDFGNMYLISNSFAEFLDSLFVVPESWTNPEV